MRNFSPTLWATMDKLFTSTEHEELFADLLADESGEKLELFFREALPEDHSAEEFFQAREIIEELAESVADSLEEEVPSYEELRKDYPVFEHFFTRKELEQLLATFWDDEAPELNRVDHYAGIYFLVKAEELQNPDFTAEDFLNPGVVPSVEFYGIGNTEAPLYDGEELRQISIESHLAGLAEFPEGLVGISDGLILQEPSEFPAPKVAGEIWTTVADVSSEQDGSHTRIAYLSVIFSREEPARVIPATDTEGNSEVGVPVDSGTVGIFPPSGILALEEKLTDELGDELIDRLESAEETENSRTLLLDLNEFGAVGHLAISAAGWGDGYYGILASVNGDGEILGYHVDFGVVGVYED